MFIPPPIGLVRAKGPPAPIFPASQAAWIAAHPTVQPPLGIWTMQDAAGPLVESVLGRHLSLTNGTAVYNDATGADPTGRNAVYLNSTSSRFRVSTASWYDVDATQSLTIIFRFKYQPGSASNGTYLVQKKSSSAGTNGYLLSSDSSASPNLTIDSPGDVNKIVALTTNHDDGKFHNYMIVVDRPSTLLRLMSDLQSPATTPLGATSTLSNALTFGLGANGAATTTSARGWFSYMALWQGVGANYALTPAQFADITSTWTVG